MAFFAWGALCAADLGQRAKRLRSQALWGLVAALASSVFCAQLCIQVLCAQVKHACNKVLSMHTYMMPGKFDCAHPKPFLTASQ